MASLAARRANRSLPCYVTGSELGVRPRRTELSNLSDARNNGSPQPVKGEMEWSYYWLYGIFKSGFTNRHNAWLGEGLIAYGQCI